MARINLLPWREAERKHRQREFAIATMASLGVAALLGLGVHYFMESIISGQQERNQYLEGEIAALDQKIKKIKDLEVTKSKLIARMGIIQQLQQSRPEVVHLFDELVVDIPDGVYLTKVEQNGKIITVEGQAQSNARVSAFMRNVEASAWVGNPSLQLIENKDKNGGGASRFRLRFEQRQVTEDEASGTGNTAAVLGRGPASGRTAKPRK
jgi:type IV pilus assembly protein PilN